MRDVVLVHGLWHGAWAWDAVATGLRARGIGVTAVELPMRTLDGDADALRRVLDAAVRPVLLVGHSYGGAVVTAAGDHPSVAHLVYLAAFSLDDDESISRVAPDAAIAPTGLAAAMRVSGDRSEVSIDPDAVGPLLYHRAPPGTAESVLGRLRPVGRALFSARPGGVAWRHRPASYVVCADDRTVAPGLQRLMAARVDHVLEWDADHSPAASRPDDVVALLADLAQREGQDDAS